MKLNVCENCKHGDELHGKSHCTKEALFSHLTNCVREKALGEFLTRNAMDQVLEPIATESVA